jgi:2-dehydro-3-deoxygluconokinase
MNGGLVTVGETLVLLSPPGVGRLRHASTLHVGIGGAESNVAIGVRRLGQRACWIGRLGADEFGDLVLGRIRSEGVDVDGAIRDPAVSTSVMVKERRTADLTRVTYYRSDGPGARLQPTDLNPDAIAGAGVLHLTGITPALSSSARETVHKAAEIARGARVPVSLDLNYRAALWTPAEAARELTELVRVSDIVFAGEDEAELLGLVGDPAEVASRLAELGPRHAVVKLGVRGAVACVDGAQLAVPAVPVQAVDPVGAGDAFVAGYLAEFLAGEPAAQMMAVAARCGAFAVTSPGDWEGLPTRSDLARPEGKRGTVIR